MNLIFQMMIIIYLFFLIPVLLGVLEAVIFRKEENRISEIVTNGYLIMLAMFLPLAVIQIQKGQTLSALAKIWGIITMISSLAGAVLGGKRLRQLLAECRKFWNGKSVLLLVVLVTIVGSVFFTRPSVEDITVLIVEASVKNDSMYQINPYTGYQNGSVESSQAYAPMEMLYAVGAQLTDMDSQVLIYYILPIVQLCIFFMAIWRVAVILLEQEEQRMWFEVITIGIYWMTTYMKEHTLMTGIFLNSWNGLTILSCIIFPLALSMVLQWTKMAEYGMKNIFANLEKGAMAVVLLFAAQLTNIKGGFYTALMIFLAIAVIIVKGGYAHGIKNGRFKKCI